MGEQNFEYDEKEHLEKPMSPILVSTKKLKNILVFIDLQKVYNSSESSFSQVGCYFDENSFMCQSEGGEELHSQSFYSVLKQLMSPSLLYSLSLRTTSPVSIWTLYQTVKRLDLFHLQHPDLPLRLCTVWTEKRLMDSN